MQCPKCGYITFRNSKTCESCQSKIKQGKGPNTAPQGTFSICADSAYAGETLAVIAEADTAVDTDTSPAIDTTEPESTGPLDTSDLTDTSFGEDSDFNLDLSDALQDEIDTQPVTDSEEASSSAGSFEMYPPPDGRTPEPDTDFNVSGHDMEGFEVEGLGFEISEEAPDVMDVNESPTLEEEPIEAEPISETFDQGETAEVSSPTDGLSYEEPESTDLEDLPEIDSEPSVELAETAVDIEAQEDFAETAPAPLEEPITEAEQIIEDPEPSVVSEPEVEVEDIGLTLEPSDEDTPLQTTDFPVEEIEIEDLGLEIESGDEDKPIETATPQVEEVEIEDLGLEIETWDDPEPSSENPTSS